MIHASGIKELAQEAPYGGDRYSDSTASEIKTHPAACDTSPGDDGVGGVHCVTVSFVSGIAWKKFSASNAAKLRDRRLIPDETSGSGERKRTSRRFSDSRGGSCFIFISPRGGKLKLLEWLTC
jgi:hypothetical protein